MINHWNIESTLNKDPGTLSAYHLCDGKITKVQLRIWQWAPDGCGGFVPTLRQTGKDPLQHGYRGECWINGSDDVAQLSDIERYVELVNAKKIQSTGLLLLRTLEKWQEFRALISKK